jgi:antitoxin component of MazEF toxin-antitoxin module
MIRFLLKRKVKVADDIIAKLDKSDLRDYDEVANQDIFEWVEQNVVPALKLILGDDVIIRNSENGDIIINSYKPRQVEDSIALIFQKCKNARKNLGNHQIKNYIKDSQFINLYHYKEDKDLLTVEEFLDDVLPGVEDILQKNEVDYVIKYRDSLFVVEIEDELDYEEFEKLENEIEGNFSEGGLTESKSHIKDDEVAELIDGDIEDIIPLDYQNFLNEVIVPAIRTKVSQVKADTVITVTTDGNMIVINTSFDEKSKPTTDEDLEVIEEDYSEEDEDDTVEVSNSDEFEEDGVKDSKISKVRLFDKVIDSIKQSDLTKLKEKLVFVGQSKGKVVRRVNLN